MYKIFLEASRDKTKNFDDAINLSTGTDKSIDPQIAVSTKDNSVLVVWTDSEPGKPQNFVKASTDNAVTSGNQELEMEVEGLTLLTSEVACTNFWGIKTSEPTFNLILRASTFQDSDSWEIRRRNSDESNIPVIIFYVVKCLVLTE